MSESKISLQGNAIETNAEQFNTKQKGLSRHMDTKINLKDEDEDEERERERNDALQNTLRYHVDNLLMAHIRIHLAQVCFVARLVSKVANLANYEGGRDRVRGQDQGRKGR